MYRRNLRQLLKKIEWEALLWGAGLIYLFLIDPYETQLFTLCPFHNVGIEFCPGCGLGRSISFLYAGDLANSLKTHPLGIIALLLISYRVISLTIKMIHNFKQKSEVQYG